MSHLPYYVTNTLIDPATQFPSQWNPKDKCSLLDLQDGEVHYTGTGTSDTDAASIRANHPIPLSCGIFYFEVFIVDKGRDGYIGVGFCAETVSLNRLPGWENYSWGLHGDDGNIFACTGNGKPYGPTFTTGDVIGCGIHLVDQYAFFTKNGVHLGTAFKDIPVNLLGKDNAPKHLFPCVGLRTPGEQVSVNFGHKPFKFDIESFIADEKSKIYHRIANSKLPHTPFSSYGDAYLKTVLNELVLSYLIHHGYSGTASLFSQNLRRTQHLAFDQDTMKDIENRHQIRQMVARGDIQEAIACTNKVYPGLFDKNEDITFQLQCRQFVEMIPKSKESEESLQEILLFGQELQNKYRSSQKPHYKRTLEETFSLIAYEDPLQSSVSHLMDPKERSHLADALNSAILMHTGRPGIPQLESIYRQSVVVMEELLKHSKGIASFINPHIDIK